MNELIELLEEGLKQYVSKMSRKEIEIIDEAISELRCGVLNRRDLRKMASKAQRVIFKYSKDPLDIDELIGYEA